MEEISSPVRECVQSDLLSLFYKKEAQTSLKGEFNLNKSFLRQREILF